MDVTIRQLDSSERDAMLKSEKFNTVSVALISTSIYDADREFAHECAKSYLFHHEPEVVNSAILALAHCSRIDGTLELTPGQTAKLQELAKTGEHTGRINDAVDDITTFTSLERGFFETHGIIDPPKEINGD